MGGLLTVTDAQPNLSTYDGRGRPYKQPIHRQNALMAITRGCEDVPLGSEFAGRHMCYASDGAEAAIVLAYGGVYL